MGNTKIEWCDATWNPIIGCSKVSPGCNNCYAEKMAGRLANMPKAPDEYKEVVLHRVYDEDTSDPVGKWNGETVMVESALEKPLHWKKPRRIFVCSMGDLFHESVGLLSITRIWMIMSMSPQHTFLILTKRPNRMKWALDLMDFDILPNVWLGVTAENQEQADKRIPILLNIPAAKRFVSIEPMIGPVDLTDGVFGNQLCNYLTGVCDITPEIKNNGLDHVIVGGESGHNARPMHPDWVRSIRDQCQEAGVPFLFKQWGEWITYSQMPVDLTIKLHNGTSNWNIQQFQTSKHWIDYFHKAGKKEAGRELDGITWDEYPKY